jgi:hypothetical protein
MAGKGNTFSADLLKLVFQAVALANIADVAASGPLANLYVSLHTADPGAGGSQNTSEAAYTGYARQPVVRTSSGWAISSQTITPVADVTFGLCTAGSETETFFGIGTLISGAGKLLYWGALSPTIVVANGVTPIVKSTTSVTEA